MNDDLISRQAAIRAINSDVTIIGRENVELVMAFIKMFVGRIKALPSADPKRKRGRWVDKSGGIDGAWNYCSVCGEQSIDLYDYCPNCGADMRGEEE